MLDEPIAIPTSASSSLAKVGSDELDFADGIRAYQRGDDDMEPNAARFGDEWGDLPEIAQFDDVIYEMKARNAFKKKLSSDEDGDDDDGSVASTDAYRQVNKALANELRAGQQSGAGTAGPPPPPPPAPPPMLNRGLPRGGGARRSSALRGLFWTKLTSTSSTIFQSLSPS